MHDSIIQGLVIFISVARIAVGIAPFIAARFAVATLKLPAEHIHSSTTVILRIFGVREVAVGALTLIFRNEASLLPALLWVNFSVDAGDAFTFFCAHRSDSTLKATAKSQGAVALLAVAGWSIALILKYLN